MSFFSQLTQFLPLQTIRPSDNTNIYHWHVHHYHKHPCSLVYIRRYYCYCYHRSTATIVLSCFASVFLIFYLSDHIQLFSHLGYYKCVQQILCISCPPCLPHMANAFLHAFGLCTLQRVCTLPAKWPAYCWKLPPDDGCMVPKHLTQSASLSL